jgi:hypothetical protein
MLDPEHATKAERIQAALAALGKQMTVEVRVAPEYPCAGDSGRNFLGKLT